MTLRRCSSWGLPALAVGVLWALSASAQTVRPVIVEYKGHARGKFELVNNSLLPANVVVEPRGFTITEGGKGVNEPLSSNVHLKLSAMSLRIPPKQGRYVFYEARADHLPAWFIIYSTFAPRPMQSGLDVQISLPHTVYLLQKQPLQRQDVSVAPCRYLSSKHRILVVISNHSSKLGRVLEWQVGSRHARQSASGFPLLPQSRRRLTMAWKSPDPPRELTFRFEHFVLKEELAGSGH
jgi:hypothetical protein